MIIIGLTIAVVFLLICISEVLWRHRGIETEYTRKFVHISVGSFVAFWPFFLKQEEVIGLSIAFVVVVAASSYFNVFKAMHSVQRPTWGEVFFAISVGALIFVAQTKWIYLAAVLHMSLADGLAATFGTKFGQKTRYHVFGHPKSFVGTLTFFITSTAILTGFVIFAPSEFNIWLPLIAIAATVLENIAIRGFDNLFVPLLVAIGLNMAH